MPRTHGAGRGTRLGFRGNITGTTYVTWPSGTTITKDTMQIKAGYVPGYASENKTIVAGVYDLGGVSSEIAASTLGLSTVDTFVCNTAMYNNTGATVGMIFCSRLAASGTSVTVWHHDNAGATNETGCSIAYFAVGTVA